MLIAAFMRIFNFNHKLTFEFKSDHWAMQCNRLTGITTRGGIWSAVNIIIDFKARMGLKVVTSRVESSLLALNLSII